MAKTSPAPEDLACPYPTCDGRVLRPPPGRRLAFCGVCGKGSAYCETTPTGRPCEALNRPLAHYCRRCQAELGPPKGAEGLWEFDTPPHAAGKTFNRVTIASVEPRGQQYQGPARRPDLVGAGGWLWLSVGDGFLRRLNPFRAEANGSSGPVLIRVSPEQASSEVRLVADGPWLLASSRKFVCAIDLVAMSDEDDRDSAPVLAWEAAGPGEKLVAGPILGRVEGTDRYSRRVAWVTNGNGGPAMWVATLDGSPSPPQVARVKIDPPSGRFPREFDLGAFGLAAPDGTAGPVVLGTPWGYYQAELTPGTGGGLEGSLRGVLPEGRPASSLPGVVVVPTRGDGPASFDLYAAVAGGAVRVPLGPNGSQVLRYPGQGMKIVPLAAGLPTTEGVLASHDAAVVLLDRLGLGPPRQVVRLDDLRGIDQARVYGRWLVAAAGTRGMTGLVVDLEQAMPMFAEQSSRPASALVPLGPSIYRAELESAGRMTVVRYDWAKTGSGSRGGLR